MSYVEISYGELALSATLLLLAGGLSLLLQLGVTRSLAISACRMAVQLALMGVILTWLFALTSWFWTTVAAVVMILFAGREVMARQDSRLTGLWSHGIGASSMAMAAALSTMMALTVILRPDPWFGPQFALPLLGLILGNTMTGIALGLRTLTSNVARDRNAIEARLILGHSRTQALGDAVREALKTALIPTINSMAAAGIVFLPGMMTGQILAGVPPQQAVKYQILVYCLIAGATALGAVAAVIGTAFRLTDQRHRLRLDRLTRA